MDTELLFKGTFTKAFYRATKILGEGGQGRVILVDSADGEQYALKWYFKSMATSDQKATIERQVAKGVPTNESEHIQYAWPIELVENESDPHSFGYVMKLIDTTKFVPFTNIRSRASTQPNLPTLSRMCANICEAIEAIHANGLAYCDVNFGNFMFDAGNGNIVVCDNDNVVVNRGDVQVAGVHEFMAPEVALGHSTPSSETDIYSLAVLFYYLWMWEHPMEGKRTLEVYSWDIPAKVKFFASEAVFHFHPSDLSNAACPEEMDLCIKKYKKCCPQKLKDAFQNSFTEGLKNPHKRLVVKEWNNLFREIEMQTVQCSCGAWNHISVDQNKTNCFHCDREIKHSTWIEYSIRGKGKFTIPVTVGFEITSEQIDKTDANLQDVIAQIENHPKQAGALILRNKTNKTLYYSSPTGDVLSIEPSKARALIPGCSIAINSATLTFVVR